MTEKVLMKGNEAIGEAAIQAGCRHFFGYPITPQNEIPEYMSRRMPQVGGVFLQAESEIAAINMVFGASGAGARVMTSSSGPGFSLKMEGISYLVGAELPAVLVNIMRGGPGLGGIQPSQGDYFQATKGGGHGDYYTLVLAPATVQEAVHLTMGAFLLAEKYRNPVIILGDGVIGQMMEPVFFPDLKEEPLEKDWVTDGARGRSRRIVKSLYLLPEKLEAHNIHLQKKFQMMRENEVRYEAVNCEGADMILVAYGIVSRICKSAMEDLRNLGLKVGLIRPISLFPFPYQAIKERLVGVNSLLVVEMSGGQMLEDVKLAVQNEVPVHFYGRMGGMVPTPDEIVERVKTEGRSGS